VEHDADLRKAAGLDAGGHRQCVDADRPDAAGCLEPSAEVVVVLDDDRPRRVGTNVFIRSRTSCGGRNDQTSISFVSESGSQWETMNGRAAGSGMRSNP